MSEVLQTEMSVNKFINMLNSSDTIQFLAGPINGEPEDLTALNTRVKVERRTNFVQFDIFCNTTEELQTIYSLLENYGETLHQKENSDEDDVTGMGVMLSIQDIPYSIIGVSPCIWAAVTKDMFSIPSGIRMLFLVDDVNMYVNDNE